MENELKISEQLAQAHVPECFSMLTSMTKSESLDVNSAYMRGYIDSNVNNLLKENSKVSKLIEIIIRDVHGDTQVDNAIKGVYKLFEIAYKAGFDCGRDFS